MVECFERGRADDAVDPRRRPAADYEGNLVYAFHIRHADTSITIGPIVIVRTIPRARSPWQMPPGFILTRCRGWNKGKLLGRVRTVPAKVTPAVDSHPRTNRSRSGRRIGLYKGIR